MVLFSALDKLMVWKNSDQRKAYAMWFLFYLQVIDICGFFAFTLDIWDCTEIKVGFA